MYQKITHIIVDVDGTMTDGGIYYDSNGNELKRFQARDAAAFWAADALGLKMIVLTGRESFAVQRRMKDLGIRHLYQGITNKKEKIIQLMSELNFSFENLGYIGDDLNDFPGMSLAAYKACPNDACEEIKSIADYISVYNGGCGAVRDCTKHLLEKQGKWQCAVNAIKKKYGMTD